MTKKENVIGMIGASVRDAEKKYLPNATISIDFLKEAIELLQSTTEENEGVEMSALDILDKLCDENLKGSYRLALPLKQIILKAMEQYALQKREGYWNVKCVSPGCETIIHHSPYCVRCQRLWES